MKDWKNVAPSEYLAAVEGTLKQGFGIGPSPWGQRKASSYQQMGRTPFECATAIAYNDQLRPV